MTSRGRLRRPSAQSITMSSGSNSRASSVGPSSFTENLTMYMNGVRDPFLPVEPAGDGLATGQIAAPTIDGEIGDDDDGDGAKLLKTDDDQAESDAPAKQRAGSIIDSEADGDLQTLRDELRAALRRHDELLAENTRLKSDLERTASKAARTNSLEPDLEKAASKAARVDSLESELSSTRATLQSTLPQLETAQRQLDVARLRTDELESSLEQQSSETRKAQEQAKAYRERVEELQRELEKQEDRQRDELDDQSLIDELEDDLERTRQELDKSIKERQRLERQLEFVKGDYDAEKQRVGELQELLVVARKNGKRRESDSAESGKSSMDREASPRPQLFSQEVDGLRAAMERAELRIDGLESQLNDARSAIQSQSKEFAATTKEAEQRAQEQQNRLKAKIHAQLQSQKEAQAQAQARSQSQRSRPGTPDSDSPMDRAEAYIRKLKAQESPLKQDLRQTRAERDELRVQLRKTEDELKVSQNEAEILNKSVEELEDVKERMGRVLMYQWGKDEVGEIEKSRTDGKKERGMGFKYKYFNKDGSVKRGGRS